MLIAVPTLDGALSAHFGRSTGLELFEVNSAERQILDSRRVELEHGQACRALPRRMRQLNVDLVIAGGIGGGAIQRLEELGMQLINGAAAQPPRQAVEDYLADRLNLTEGRCTGHHDHDHDHECHTQES